MRYGTHVYGYVLLGGESVPGLHRRRGHVSRRSRDRPARAAVALEDRASGIILAIPALILSAALVGGLGSGGGGGSDATSGSEEAYYYWGGSMGLAFTIAFFAWFACLVRARMPNGFRDALAYALRYSAQAYGYLLFLTDRYPHRGSRAKTPCPRRRRRGRSPCRRTRTFSGAGSPCSSGSCSRSRTSSGCVLWGIAVFLALIVGWFAAIILGRLPDALPSLRRRVPALHDSPVRVPDARRQPVPGLHGNAGHVPGRAAHRPARATESAWTILFRVFLAFPALFVDVGAERRALLRGHSSAGSRRWRPGACRRASGRSANGRSATTGRPTATCISSPAPTPTAARRRVEVPEAVEEEEPVDTWPEPPDAALVLGLVALAAGLGARRLGALADRRSRTACARPTSRPRPCSTPICSTRRATSSSSSGSASSSRSSS